MAAIGSRTRLGAYAAKANAPALSGAADHDKGKV